MLEWLTLHEFEWLPNLRAASVTAPRVGQARGVARTSTEAPASTTFSMDETEKAGSSGTSDMPDVACNSAECCNRLVVLMLCNHNAGAHGPFQTQTPTQFLRTACVAQQP